jgi:ABC-2 type transport system ATP-binding protein
VIATHLIEEIAQMVDHVFVIGHGVVQVDADTEPLLNTARILTGSIQAVDAATQQLTVLKHKDMGNMRTVIAANVPADFAAPSDVEVSGVDLQTLFIALTGREGDQHE